MGQKKKKIIDDISNNSKAFLLDLSGNVDMSGSITIGGHVVGYLANNFSDIDISGDVLDISGSSEKHTIEWDNNYKKWNNRDIRIDPSYSHLDYVDLSFVDVASLSFSVPDESYNSFFDGYKYYINSEKFIIKKNNDISGNDASFNSLSIINNMVIPSYIYSDTLYYFVNHTFTSCGQTGRYGPQLNDCISEYTASWTNNSNFFSVPHRGYQMWTVPVSAWYRVTCYGAGQLADKHGWSGSGFSGNSSYTNEIIPASRGAVISGDVYLKKGDKYIMLIGQKGANIACGNGGTFFAKGDDYTQANPIIVAGGGGGSSIETHMYHRHIDSNASISEDGNTGGRSDQTPNRYLGTNGTNGNSALSGHPTDQTYDDNGNQVPVAPIFDALSNLV